MSGHVGEVDAYRRGAARPERTWDDAFEDASRPTLEVIVTWRNNPVFVVHRTPPTDFSVGTDADCAIPEELLGAERRRLVRVVDGEVRVVVFEGARGRLDLDDADLAFEDARAMRRLKPSAGSAQDGEVRLPLGRSATFELGELRIEIAHVAAGRRPARHPRWRWALPLVASLVLHVALAWAVAAQDARPEGDSIDKGTAEYLLELAEKTGPGLMEDAPVFRVAQSCIGYPYPREAMDSSLEKKRVIAESRRRGSEGVVRTVLLSPRGCGSWSTRHFDAVCWPRAVRGRLSAVRARTELLRPDLPSQQWGEPPPLGPVGALQLPVAGDGASRALRVSLARFEVRHGKITGAPEMVRILMANADVMLGCVLDALDAGAPALETVVDLSATEGEVSSVTIRGGEEAAACLRGVLERLGFPPSDEAAARSARFALSGGPGELPYGIILDEDSDDWMTPPLTSGPGE